VLWLFSHLSADRTSASSDTFVVFLAMAKSLILVPIAVRHAFTGTTHSGGTKRSSVDLRVGGSTATESGSYFEAQIASAWHAESHELEY
jgi:hypothetical protein